jgi:hypothetical protein
MDNCNWFVKLYSNIKTRLSEFVIRKELRNEFEKDFDISKLQEIIDKGIFNLVFVSKIIENVFKWIVKLQLSDKNMGDIEDTRQNIMTEDNIIFTFQEINRLIDVMDKDFEEVSDRIAEELVAEIKN